MKPYRETHGLLLATVLLTLTVPSKNDPTAAELLRHAADNLAVTTALHFSYTAHSVTPGFQLGALAAGNGSIIWPDSLVFNGTIQSSPVLAAPFAMVTCGPKQYFEMGDGKFQQMQGLPDIRRVLFAPDSGLMTGVLKKLEHLSTPRAEKLDTVATWRMGGTVPNQSLAMLPGRGAAVSAGVVRAELWIGQKDLRLRQVTLTGPMFGSDSAQTSRTFTFSRFNERAPLAVSRGHSPCSTQP